MEKRNAQLESVKPSNVKFIKRLSAVDGRSGNGVGSRNRVVDVQR